MMLAEILRGWDGHAGVDIFMSSAKQGRGKLWS